MALDQSALLALVESMKAGDDGELMRRLLAAMLQELVEAEATAVIGAGLHERTETRTTQRNGTRDKTLTTGVGDVTVKIPKTRTGSFFPALLAPRRRIDVALHAVIMQAYVEGVSTRRVDDWWSRWVAPGCPRARCPGSAPDSTARWPRGGPAHWTTSRSRMCSLMPPTARPGSTAGWCPRRW